LGLKQADALPNAPGAVRYTGTMGIFAPALTLSMKLQKPAILPHRIRGN